MIWFPAFKMKILIIWFYQRYQQHFLSYFNALAVGWLTSRIVLNNHWIRNGGPIIKFQGSLIGVYCPFPSFTQLIFKVIPYLRKNIRPTFLLPDKDRFIFIKGVLKCIRRCHFQVVHRSWWWYIQVFIFRIYA